VVGSFRSTGSAEKLRKFVFINNLPVKFYSPANKDIKFRYFLNSDIFIFPPREPEGHPWVIIEAMAAGLPIISTDQGAITESVIDGINGFIVEKQNPKQIAEKLKLLIENKELRERMGKESRRLYEENFTEEKMVARLKNVFNTVLGEKPGA
jgi:glycosyltransferase involved in cell wall biosynthesis